MLQHSKLAIARMLIITLLLGQFPQEAFAMHVSTVASQAPAEAPDSGIADNDGSVELAPGFLMQLSSSQDSKLNGTFRIQPTGNIDLPYSIELNAKGLTLEQFREKIAEAYAGYFKGAPKVAVSVKQKRYWVEVLGLVAKPGEYLLRQDSPLDEIISQAGGITEDLNTGFARIVQGGKTSWIDLADYYKGHQTDVPLWQGGDKIFFQRERPEFAADPLDTETARKVEMMGEVRQPGELTYHREADIYYYLIKSGGPTTSADLDRVGLIRPDRQTGQRKEVSLGSVEKITAVKGGDILMFYPTRPSTLDRTLAIGATVTAILTAIALTVVAIHTSNK